MGLPSCFYLSPTHTWCHIYPIEIEVYIPHWRGEAKWHSSCCVHWVQSKVVGVVKGDQPWSAWLITIKTPIKNSPSTWQINCQPTLRVWVWQGSSVNCFGHQRNQINESQKLGIQEKSRHNLHHHIITWQMISIFDFPPEFSWIREANKYNTFLARVISKLLYTTTLLCRFRYYIAIEHNKLNVEREGKGVRGGFFLGIWICVNSIANHNCCILQKVGYATTIKREGRKRGKAFGTEVKLCFMNIIDWY